MERGIFVGATRRRLLVAAACMVGVLVATGMGGCSEDGFLGPCACTLEFRFFTATVVDGGGAPVLDATVAVTRVRDGFSYDVDQGQGISGGGRYIILDDGFKGEVAEGGEAVRVVVSKDGASVTGDYVFASDDCDCHISKISGPDTLTLGGGS